MFISPPSQSATPPGPLRAVHQARSAAPARCRRERRGPGSQRRLRRLVCGRAARRGRELRPLLRGRAHRGGRASEVPTSARVLSQHGLAQRHGRRDGTPRVRQRWPADRVGRVASQQRAEGGGLKKEEKPAGVKKKTRWGGASSRAGTFRVAGGGKTSAAAVSSAVEKQPPAAAQA